MKFLLVVLASLVVLAGCKEPTLVHNFEAVVEKFELKALTCGGVMYPFFEATFDRTVTLDVLRHDDGYTHTQVQVNTVLVTFPLEISYRTRTKDWSIDPVAPLLSQKMHSVVRWRYDQDGAEPFCEKEGNMTPVFTRFQPYDR